MDTLNLLFGLVTVVSLIFSVWIYFNEKKKRDVETEKSSQLRKKIGELSEIIDSTGAQLNLVVQLSRRETTTIEELRHIIVAIQFSVIGLSNIVNEKKGELENWKYGSPSEYAEIKKDEENQKE